MKTNKKIFGIIIALVLAVSMTACGKEDEAAGNNGNSDGVNIAVAGPMTGDTSEYGIGFYNAVSLQAKEWNDKGGIDGKEINVEKFDDVNSPEEGVSVANMIASRKDIHGVIGHFASGVSMAAAPIYEENSIVEISPSASHPDYSGIGEYIFRNNTVIHSEAQASLDIAVNDFKTKKIGMISIKTDWGVSTSQIVKDLASKMDGVDIVAHEEVIEGSDDYRPAITSLQKAGAETVIVVGMYNTVAPVAIQYKETNPDIKIVGFSNAYSQQLLELGGKSVEGIAFPVIFFAESDEPVIKTFVDSYEKEYGSVPSALTAQAYDSAGIFFETVKEVGSQDPEKIKQAIYKMEYNGVTGKTKFDENGDVEKSFTKVVIKDGKFEKMDK